MSWLTDLFGRKNSKPINRGMWVWHLNSEDIDNIVSFCERKKINEVYLCVDTNANKNSLSFLIEVLHSKNIKVQYLEGLQVKGDEDPNKALIRIGAVMAMAKWDGVHLDYEIAKGCPTKAFNGFLETVLKGLKNYDVEVDLEWWRADSEYFTTIGILADSMCVMGYANNYWDTRGKVQKALNRVKIPFKIGIETIDDPAVKDISFWNSGEKRMEDMILNLNSWGQSKKGYSGIAIHHWDSYRRLKV